jgi:hypothetical protein
LVNDDRELLNSSLTVAVAATYKFLEEHLNKHFNLSCCEDILVAATPIYYSSHGKEQRGSSLGTLYINFTVRRVISKKKVEEEVGGSHKNYKK